MWPFKRRGKTPEANSAASPPIDVNQPVENPRLIAAIAQFGRAPTEQALTALLHQLNQAIYLVAILTDEMTTTPDTQPGTVTINQGSLLKILSCSDEAGARLLPVFSDWNEIRAWTSEPVSALVMPARDVWDWLAAAPDYTGMVVNPAGTALPLDLDQVRDLKRMGAAG